MENPHLLPIAREAAVVFSGETVYNSRAAPARQIIGNRCNHVSRSDQRKYHKGASAVCAADDCGEFAPAVLQHRRHAHCRAGAGQKRAGSGGLGIHAHDVSDVDFPGTFDGRGRAVFDLPRKKGLRRAAKRSASCAGSDLCGDGCLKRAGLCVFRPDSAFPADSGRTVQLHARVSGDYFRWTHCDVSL